ncbi:hypothetical protein J2X50_002116 [Aminobacter sp. BE322]
MRTRHGTAVHIMTSEFAYHFCRYAGKDYLILGVDEFARVCNLTAGLTDEH